MDPFYTFLIFCGVLLVGIFLFGYLAERSRRRRL